MIYPICTSCDSYPCACGRCDYVSRPFLACAPMVERGWLIESTYPNGPPEWLANLIGSERWTADSEKAIRFSRQCDAERLIDGMVRQGLAGLAFAIATEHQWGVR